MYAYKGMCFHVGVCVLYPSVVFTDNSQNILKVCMWGGGEKENGNIHRLNGEL